MAKKTEDLESKIVQAVYAKLFKHFLLFLALLTGITGLSLWGIKNSLEGIITDRISRQFEEPRIKKSLEDVAKNQANIIITKEVQPSVDKIKVETNQSIEEYHKYIDEFKNNSQNEYKALTNEIDGIKKEIALFKKFMAGTKTDYTKELENVSQQVKILDERNKLTMLGDKAIAWGDSKALEDLELYSKQHPTGELDKAVTAEILRVKSFYAGSRVAGRDIEVIFPDGNKYTNGAIPTNILLLGLDDPDWAIRTKSAEMLAYHKEKKVPDALLKTMANDPRLDTRKAALDAFEKINGYRKVDILDNAPARDWWKIHKQNVETEFGKIIDKTSTTNPNEQIRTTVSDQKN
jgi:hypothetical protein